MKFVVFDAIDTDRLESSEADVEGDIDGLDAALADAVEDVGSEVKAGGRGGYGSVLLGVDGLIALAIVGRIGTRNVRRKRDMADAIERGKEIAALPDGVKANSALAESGASEHLGMQFIGTVLAEEQVFADADLAAGTNQAFPIVGFDGKLAREQNFDAAAEKIARGRMVRAERFGASALAAAIKPRRKNAGVVEDHQIPGLQEVGKVIEPAVGMVAGGSLQVEHAGSVARGEGLLGD
jgi:hypothetical protein